MNASDAVEIIITDDEQIERIGTSILSIADGEARAIAIRRLCRSIQCELIDHPIDKGKIQLHVNLLKPKDDFLGDYEQVGLSSPGEDFRTYGCPKV